MKKKIAIDCSKLNILNKTGTHRFLIGFLNEVTKNDDFQYYFYYQTYDQELNNFPFIERGEVIVLEERLFYTQLGLLKELDKYDYFIFPWQTLPIFSFSKNCKKVSIIHDLGFSFRTRVFTLLTIFLSDKLFSVSDYTAKKILRNSVVISEGVDGEVFHKISPKEINFYSSNLNIPKFFVLSIGRVEKRKNIYNNLKAFKRVSEIYPTLKYCFIGNMVETEDKIYSFIDKLKIDRGKILFKNYLPDFELNIYLNSCEFVIFTPFEEGFGLPAIESYYVEKPVILSKIQPLADISLSATHLVDPYEANEISEKMILFLKDTSKIKRNLDFKSIIKKFNWKNTSNIFLSELGK